MLFQHDCTCLTQGEHCIFPAEHSRHHQSAHTAQLKWLCEGSTEQICHYSIVAVFYFKVHLL